jgi:hypothetical protein
MNLPASAHGTQRRDPERTAHQLKSGPNLYHAGKVLFTVISVRSVVNLFCPARGQFQNGYCRTTAGEFASCSPNSPIWLEAFGDIDVLFPIAIVPITLNHLNPTAFLSLFLAYFPYAPKAEGGGCCYRTPRSPSAPWAMRLNFAR